MTPGTKVRMLPGSTVSLTAAGREGITTGSSPEEGIIFVLWDGDTTPDPEHTEDLEIVEILDGN
jgi:hypothetical protein